MSTWSAPVRYAECDQQGIVFNAHYLTWADEAFTAFLAERGTPYAAVLERGLDTAVVATALQYAAPVRWGDVVEAEVGVERFGRTSMTVAIALQVGGEVRCTVRTTYVMTDHDRVPVPVPDDLREAWG